MAQQPQRPIKEFRAGNVKAAIWKQEREDQGHTTATYSVKIQKRYFDKATQEWRDTDYFFVDELPRLRLVADQAFQFITLRESEDTNGEERRV